MLKRIGLTGKLLSLLLAFGLVPSVLMIGLLLANQSRLTDIVLARIADSAQHVAETIDRNLFERYGDVQAFGLNAAAHDPANWRKPGAETPLVQAMNSYMTGYGVYRLMLLVDTKGEVLAVNTANATGKPLDTAKFYGQSFANAPWHKKALAEQFLKGRNGFTGTVVEPAGFAPELAALYGNDGLSVIFAAPVKNGAGDLVGVWANFTDFSVVEEIVQETYKKLSARGEIGVEVTLLDGEGRVLMDYDPTLKGTSDVVRDRSVIGQLNLVRVGVTAAKAAVTDGKSGSMVSTHARKKIEQATGYARSDGAYDYPGLGWSVLVGAPTEHAFAGVRVIVNLMLGVIGVAVLAILVLGLLFARSFIRPITTLDGTMTALARGDKGIVIPFAQRTDEIGGMARAVSVFNDAMVDAARLRNEQARDAALKRTAEQVAGSVDAIRAAASEISQGSDNLATRTERQASALQETVATMAEISENVSANARNSERARQLAADALARAEGGNDAVVSVVTAMSGIETSSARIGEIIQVMEEISFQTKLLALNAAVEAARAGDAGKGFAVVAQEVRALADRSRQAAQQVRELIAQSAREVGQGVTLAGRAGEALLSVIEIVRRLAEIAPEIAAGSRDQSRSLAEINKALSDLDATTQQNAALVQQSSAAAASLADQAGQLVAVTAGFRAGSDAQARRE